MPYYPPAPGGGGGGGGAVDSVNSKTGVVVLTAADVGAVSSINEQTGVVVLTAADVGAVPASDGMEPTGGSAEVWTSGPVQLKSAVYVLLQSEYNVEIIGNQAYLKNKDGVTQVMAGDTSTQMRHSDGGYIEITATGAEYYDFGHPNTDFTVLTLNNLRKISGFTGTAPQILVSNNGQFYWEDQ